jgi:uncharacterized protein YndB with AHSA1/START domain
MTDDPLLLVRRTIRAPAARVFEAWTVPEHLMRWWGPKGAHCPEATVDLRPGGAYRIANRFSDGNSVWIVGEFEAVEPPHRLVYSWRLEPGPATRERVVVSFAAVAEGTEVTVRHERIGDAALREGHEAGWRECLDGLETYFTARVGPAV